MICPVCDSDKMKAGVSSCSACKSDLSAYNHVNNLAKKQGILKMSSIIFAIIAVVASGVIFWQLNANNSIAATTAGIQKATTDNAAKMQTQLDDKDKTIAELEAKLSEFTAVVDSTEEDVLVNNEEQMFLMHVVEYGESFWSIAEKYHGSGFHQHMITTPVHLDNGQLVLPGDTVFIKQ
jgi:uncharacterized protein HemX